MVEFTENHHKSFKIKLKFSKVENEEEDKNIESKEKVCEVCNKVFGSRKALGGHMRIHFQAYKDRSFKENKKKKLMAQECMKLKKLKNSSSSSNLDESGSDEPRCALCGKIFPSMKSLFGHMRCHPEREWRGIHPPSDPEVIDDDLGGDDYEFLEAHNAMGVLPKWSVTAKRRRKAANVVIDDVEEEFGEGVDYLMMLAKATGDSSHHHSSDFAQKGEENFEVTSSNSLEKNVVGSDDELKRCDNSLIGKEGLIVKRKKMKLIRDLDEIQDMASPQVMASPPAVDIDKHKCNICGKCFATHQALGGHKSSHNKHRMYIQNCMDDHRYYSPPIATHTQTPPKKVIKIIKESQENDEGFVGTQQHHQYLSKVCNKIFYSGQALGVGGPNWDNSVCLLEEVKAQSITIQDKVVSQTNGRVLGFDLNELPPVEEEEEEEDDNDGEGQHHFASSSHLLN